MASIGTSIHQWLHYDLNRYIAILTSVLWHPQVCIFSPWIIPSLRLFAILSEWLIETDLIVLDALSQLKHYSAFASIYSVTLLMKHACLCSREECFMLPAFKIHKKQMHRDKNVCVYTGQDSYSSEYYTSNISNRLWFLLRTVWKEILKTVYLCKKYCMGKDPH